MIFFLTSICGFPHIKVIFLTAVLTEQSCLAEVSLYSIGNSIVYDVSRATLCLLVESDFNCKHCNGFCTPYPLALRIDQPSSPCDVKPIDLPDTDSFFYRIQIDFLVVTSTIMYVSCNLPGIYNMLSGSKTRTREPGTALTTTLQLWSVAKPTRWISSMGAHSHSLDIIILSRILLIFGLPCYLPGEKCAITVFVRSLNIYSSIRFICSLLVMIGYSFKP